MSAAGVLKGAMLLCEGKRVSKWCGWDDRDYCD